MTKHARRIANDEPLRFALISAFPSDAGNDPILASNVWILRAHWPPTDAVMVVHWEIRRSVSTEPGLHSAMLRPGDTPVKYWQPPTPASTAMVSCWSQHRALASASHLLIGGSS